MLIPTMRNCGVFVLLTVASLVILNNVERPFIWIGVIWTSLFMAFTLLRVWPFSAAVWFNFGFFCLALTAAEIYLEVADAANWTSTALARRMREEGSFPSAGHQVLGYGPARISEAVTVRKFLDDEPIFDVVYTINEAGLRASPPSAEARESILFFGGSFTFGTGVNDDETMPHRVGVATKGKYRVFNFGYAGYGPHQMLAAIEGGLVDEVVSEPPKYVIYQAIPHHVERAAGLTDWDHNGPRYQIEHGTVIQAGRFSDGGQGVMRNATLKLRRSLLFDRIYTSIQGSQERESEIQLFGAIVERARATIKRKFPTCEFHTVFWGSHDDERSRAIQTELQRRNIPVHCIDEIIPEISESRDQFFLKYDGHPKPKAHSRVAQYVTDRIVR